jgi:hypothetical protein
MIPVLAHQGGWDEILIPAIAVLAMLGVGRLRRRRGSAAAGADRAGAVAGACAYCGAVVPDGAARCPACGFRTAGATRA